MIVSIVAALLAAPTFFTVAHVCAARPHAPLVRGSLERACVLAASGIAVIAAFIGAVIAAGELAIPAFGLLFPSALLPPLVGLAPWTAGEILSGPSQRPELSLAASLCTAYLAAALGFFLLIPLGWPVALVAAGGSSAALSSGAYLAARGAA